VLFAFDTTERKIAYSRIQRENSEQSIAALKIAGELTTANSALYVAVASARPHGGRPGLHDAVARIPPMYKTSK
jgi:hypothetical protein